MRSRSMRAYKLFCGVALCAMTINAIAPVAAAAAAARESGSNDGNTTTPIKHVIVIIGENRTFDHLFATYVPKHKTDTVLNLLSQGIVNADGTPGPNYSAATQYGAIDSAPDPYLISPPRPARTMPPVPSRRHWPTAVRRLSRLLQKRTPTSMGCRRAITNI
jgi:phospholipase C